MAAGGAHQDGAGYGSLEEVLITQPAQPSMFSDLIEVHGFARTGWSISWE
jgi:hypothetical protein